MDLYLKDALSIDDVKDRGDRLRARKAELTLMLKTAAEPPPLLHPAMAEQYRIRIQNLYEALQHDSEGKRMEAAEIIRSLVDSIILKPEDGKVAIEVRGDLAGILTLSVKTKNPADMAGSSQVKVVAGGRNRGNSRSVKKRVVRESDVAEIARQASAILKRSRRLQPLCIAEA